MLKVLWVATDLLHPQDRGGRIRTMHIAGSLMNEWIQDYAGLVRGHKAVALAGAAGYARKLISCDHPEDLDSRQKLSMLLRSFVSGRPFSIERFVNADFTRKVEQFVKDEKPDLIICDFVHAFEAVRGIDGIPMVLFQHNAEASLWQRRFVSEKFGPGKLAYWIQWQSMLRYEKQAIERSRAVVCVSQEDARLFSEQYAATNCRVIETGVDVDSISYDWVPDRKSPYCLFVGSLDWEPNSEGILWFLEKVWPSLKLALPELRFQIVGKNPSEHLRQLVQRSPGAELVGRVDSVQPYLRGAAVSIVPLLTGGGTRMKIFESFAAGVPVVSTPLGAEGLKVEDSRHIEISADPQQFGARVLKLLKDERAAQELSLAARQLVVERHSARSVAMDFMRICEDAVSHGARQGQ